MEEQAVQIIVKSAPLTEWAEEYQLLHKEAIAATSTAYVPYSRFQVGAAVLLANGEVVSASNQENAAYPSGLCAERVALFYAGAKYPDVPVKAIAIAARTKGKLVEGISPCGGCRQVMLETETRAGSPIRIFLCGSDKMRLIDSAASLLPIGFDGSDL
jgi:Cytidine deaminase